MRTLVVTEFITVDGVVEAPGGGDHPHAGWTFRDVEFDEAAYDIKGREILDATALLLGRRSYDEFAPAWPSMDEHAARPTHGAGVSRRSLRDLLDQRGSGERGSGEPSARLDTWRSQP